MIGRKKLKRKLTVEGSPIKLSKQLRYFGVVMDGSLTRNLEATHWVHQEKVDKQVVHTRRLAWMNNVIVLKDKFILYKPATLQTVGYATETWFGMLNQHTINSNRQGLYTECHNLWPTSQPSEPYRCMYSSARVQLFKKNTLCIGWIAIQFELIIFVPNALLWTRRGRSGSILKTQIFKNKTVCNH